MLNVEVVDYYRHNSDPPSPNSEHDTVLPLLSSIHKSVLRNQAFRIDPDTALQQPIAVDSTHGFNDRVVSYFHDGVVGRLTVGFLTPELVTHPEVARWSKTYTIIPMHCAYGGKDTVLHGDLKLKSPLPFASEDNLSHDISAVVHAIGMQFDPSEHFSLDGRLLLEKGVVPRPVFDMVLGPLYRHILWAAGYSKSPDTAGRRYDEFFDPNCYRRVHTVLQSMVDAHIVEEAFDRRGRKEYRITEYHEDTFDTFETARTTLLDAIKAPSWWEEVSLTDRQRWTDSVYRGIDTFTTTDFLDLEVHVDVPEHEYRCGVVSYRDYQDRLNEYMRVITGHVLWEDTYLVSPHARTLEDLPTQTFRAIEYPGVSVIVGLSPSSGICAPHLREQYGL